MTTVGNLARQPSRRCRGYAPLRSYAAIGDGRTVALVSDDGTIDWLALPDLDSPSVFGALLDGERGGCFALAPSVPFRVARRYVPATNVLETTFSTAGGVVRVLDAMTVQGRTLGPFRELQRRIEGVAGRVPMSWSVQPQFRYAAAGTRLAWRAGVPVAVAGNEALAVCAFQVGTPEARGGVIAGRFEATSGRRGLLALCAAHQEPLVFPARQECDERFDQTVAAWQTWVSTRAYDGPWSDMVMRSALALKMLVQAPSGAVAAAATTSLPEDVGGERNWDYRFCWVRDAAFTLAALLRLGLAPEARSYFWWLVQASQLTHPRGVAPL